MKTKDIKKLDKIWREQVFERDRFICQKCRKRNCRLNAHHIFSKKIHRKVRWKVSNGITLCFRCHIYGAHSDPKWGKWVEEWLGLRTFNKLDKIKDEIDKRTFEEVKKDLEEQSKS